MLPRRRPSILLPSVLALGCVGIGVFIYYDLRAAAAVDGAADRAAGAGVQTVQPLPSEPLFVMRPIQSFDGIVERPIFIPSRRPVNDDELNVATPATPLALELKGVVIASDTRVALFMTENDPAIHRLRLGQSHDGWDLTAIDHDSVTFQRGGETRRLHIAFDTAPPRPRGRPDRRARDARQPTPPDAGDAAAPNRDRARRPVADGKDVARP